MEFQLSMPGKTYIFGEYLSLLGGPALLLNSAPRFNLFISKNLTGQLVYENFSENIAIKYLNKYVNFFKNYSLRFEDPYQGLGGFGASSAQYGMLTAFKYYIENKPLNFSEIIKEYQSLITNNNHYLPSGADIIAQLTGYITYYCKNENLIENLIWPFPQLDFALIHTGHKIYTDQHIADLKKFESINFDKIVRAGFLAITEADANKFCDAINDYDEAMQQQKLVNDQTKRLLSEIKKNKFILAAKGCGALAADVILVCFAKKFRQDFLKFSQQLNLNVIRIDNQVNQGFALKEQNSDKLMQVILVDEKDQQIGITEKLQAHQQAQLHRAFSVFIFRQKNDVIEVLLQQRSNKKYHTGGLWSNTCCSHPAPGEDVLQSAKKRLQLEMGITADLYEIGAFRYIADLGNGLVEHEYDHVFLGIYQNDPITIDHNEIDKYQWVDFDKLFEDLKNHPENYTPWLRQAIELILKNNIFLETLNYK